ncbi:hypothetical protein A0H81_04827 [Grifola frondosa]|uniref:Uncharacterized protein n=1 Tax=Grifola frondosa TaxID=5627 RepID=A0A1C7MFH3_GRIFR|nr:hypothetical protein A0H81_04827 [Grifola frondosa]
MQFGPQHDAVPTPPNTTVPHVGAQHVATPTPPMSLPLPTGPSTLNLAWSVPQIDGTRRNSAFIDMTRRTVDI